jgi:hypothetical protein
MGLIGLVHEFMVQIWTALGEILGGIGGGERGGRFPWCTLGDFQYGEVS